MLAIDWIIRVFLLLFFLLFRIVKFSDIIALIARTIQLSSAFNEINGSDPFQVNVIPTDIDEMRRFRGAADGRGLKSIDFARRASVFPFGYGVQRSCVRSIDTFTVQSEKILLNVFISYD